MNHVYVLLFMTVDFFDSSKQNLFQKVFLSLLDLDFNSKRIHLDELGIWDFAIQDQKFITETII